MSIDRGGGGHVDKNHFQELGIKHKYTIVDEYFSALIVPEMMYLRSCLVLTQSCIVGLEYTEVINLPVKMFKYFSTVYGP